MSRSPLLLSKAFMGLARSSCRVRFSSAKALQHSLQRSGSAFSPVTSFTSRPFSSSETLSGLLSRELAEEQEDGGAEMPADLAELKNTIEKDWKIVDDGATTRLFRSIGASKVAISFHCQDTVEGEGSEYTEEEGEEPAVPFRFEVHVSKAGNTLVLSCFSDGGETTVDGVAMSTEDVESIQVNGIGRNQYQGPEFPELAEDLQDAFHEFVFSELGVNEDVSAFVSMYADYKEQSEYVDFLKNVSKVLP